MLAVPMSAKGVDIRPLRQMTGDAEFNEVVFDGALAIDGAAPAACGPGTVCALPAIAIDAPDDALLTGVLKQGWGFQGFVISDAAATGGATVLHHTEASTATAARHAIESGLDVIFQSEYPQHRPYLAAFRSAGIAPALIDSAVVRVLRVKFALGLFESPRGRGDRGVCVCAEPARGRAAAIRRGGQPARGADAVSDRRGRAARRAHRLLRKIGAREWPAFAL